MSYDVYFELKLAGPSESVPVGEEFITISSDSGAVVKDVCNEWPSEWDGKTAKTLIPTLDAGSKFLYENPEQLKLYKRYYGSTRMIATQEFMKRVLKNCRQYPSAVVRVVY